jgi:hypothetical protein
MHCSDPQPYVVEHRLHHRVRIRFQEPLAPSLMRSLIWLIDQHQMGIALRPTASGKGLVLWCQDPEQPISKGLRLLEAMLLQPPAHLVAPPEPGLRGVLQRSRLGGIKVLMALAVAGWALPVLPGTPFFLMAWWLGWRPETSQRNPTSRNGERTLADTGTI